MSALTPHSRSEARRIAVQKGEPMPDFIKATPADVRLWLLDQGAEERCGFRFGKAICGLLVAEHPDTWTQWPADRHDVVSVLVWPIPDSEQVSSDTD